MQYSRHGGSRGGAHKLGDRSSSLHKQPYQIRKDDRDGVFFDDGHRGPGKRRNSVVTDRDAKPFVEETGAAIETTRPLFPMRQRHQQISFTGTVSHNLVSFYFTNVPDNITYSSLRQGFEVCGVMEDVYLARKRNVNGALWFCPL